MPYALVLLGLLGACTTFPRMYAPHEKSPTPVQMSTNLELPANKNWFKIEGAGLYPATTIYSYKTKKSTGKSRVTGYLVPVLLPWQASAWTARRGEPPAGTRQVVLARVSASEFTSRFPNFDNPRFNTYYKQMEITGTRGLALDPEEARLVRSQFHVDPANVVVIDFNNEPMSPTEAFNMFALAVTAVVGGGVWLWVRFKSNMPHVGDLTTDTYVPPVPEMPPGGWFAQPSQDTPQRRAG